MTNFERITKDVYALACFLGVLNSRGNTNLDIFEMREWSTKRWLDYLKKEGTEKWFNLKEQTNLDADQTE